MGDLIYANVIPLVLGIGVVSAAVIKVKGVLKESAEVLLAVVNALEDGKITKEEVEKVVKEGKDVISAFKGLK